VPAGLYAAVIDPISVIWVALIFLAIHQIEGHVVIPNVMSRAVRLHPLLVIFGLLAGGEVYGLPGILVALPLLAAGRAMWEFFAERIHLERWTAGPVPVEVEIERPPPEPPQPAVVVPGPEGDDPPRPGRRPRLRSRQRRT
jgi:hypothetical protein